MTAWQRKPPLSSGTAKGADGHQQPLKTLGKPVVFSPPGAHGFNMLSLGMDRFPGDP